MEDNFDEYIFDNVLEDTYLAINIELVESLKLIPNIMNGVIIRERLVSKLR